MADSLDQELERNIPLYEMIQSLRNELKAAVNTARGDDLRLAVRSVELSLQVTVTRERQAGGGIKFWVVNASGGHKAADQGTHTFKLTLEPMTESRGEVYVSDEVSKKPT